jgi:rhodanese-related sulfurtransferase
MNGLSKSFAFALLGLSMFITPNLFARADETETLVPGMNSSKVCLECHRAQPQTFMGKWTAVAMKSATIQLEVDERSEVLSFDKAALEVSNSDAGGDLEKMLRGIKAGQEVMVRYQTGDGIRSATSITIKPPLKLAAGEKIDIPRLEKLVRLGPQKGGYLLVDSRPSSSFRAGEIPTAVNIPFTEFNDKSAQLPKDRQRLIVFYGDDSRSRMGSESMKKARALGYKNVKVLTGGMDGWQVKNFNTLTPEEFADVYRDIPVVLIDVRPLDQTGKGFIKGSVAFTAKTVLPGKALHAPIIVYDDNGNGNARKVASEIVKSGQERVMLLVGGFEAAKKAQIPTGEGMPANKITYTPRPMPGSFPVDKFSRMVESPPADVLFIDVRNSDELQEGTIKGSVNIPTQEFFRRAVEVPRDKKVIAYCNSGSRAEMAYHILRDRGYNNVYFLKAHVDFDEGKPDIYE